LHLHLIFLFFCFHLLIYLILILISIPISLPSSYVELQLLLFSFSNHLQLPLFCNTIENLPTHILQAQLSAAFGASSPKSICSIHHPYRIFDQDAVSRHSLHLQATRLIPETPCIPSTTLPVGPIAEFRMLTSRLPTCTTDPSHSFSCVCRSLGLGTLRPPGLTSSIFPNRSPLLCSVGQLFCFQILCAQNKQTSHSTRAHHCINRLSCCNPLRVNSIILAFGSAGWPFDPKPQFCTIIVCPKLTLVATHT
jgi:hypothetical protein